MHKKITRLAEADTEIKTEKVGEPYANVPPELTGAMDECVNSVMADNPELEKENAIAICFSSVVEGKDLADVMKSFILSQTPSTSEPENDITQEAATHKSKIKAAIKAIDELLELKEVPETLREQIKSIQTIFRTKAWQDLANEVLPSEKSKENLQENVSNNVTKFSENYSGVVLREVAALPPSRAPIEIEAQLISPGWGNPRDNNYYSPEVIKEAEELFAGKKMYVTNHVDSEKNVMTEVGKINKITGYTDAGANIASVTIFHPDFAEMVRAREMANELNTLECSILGNGTYKVFEKDGRKGKAIEKITEIESVDWVSRAGAGGKALGAISENLPKNDPKEEEQINKNKIQELLDAEKHLPEAAKAKLLQRQYKTIAELEQTVKDEISYLKEILGSGKPFGLGSPKTETLSETDRRQRAWDAMDAINKKHFGG